LAKGDLSSEALAKEDARQQGSPPDVRTDRAPVV